MILGTLTKAQAPNMTHFFMVYPLEKKNMDLPYDNNFKEIDFID